MLKCKGHPDVRHVDCGGQIAIEGEGYIQLPSGFGFDGPRFVVDAVRCPAYKGFCMKCSAEGMFARQDRKPKAVRTVPRAINRRIRAATRGAGR